MATYETYQANEYLWEYNSSRDPYMKFQNGGSGAWQLRQDFSIKIPIMNTPFKLTHNRVLDQCSSWVWSVRVYYNIGRSYTIMLTAGGDNFGIFNVKRSFEIVLRLTKSIIHQDWIIICWYNEVGDWTQWRRGKFIYSSEMYGAHDYVDAFPQ